MVVRIKIFSVLFVMLFTSSVASISDSTKQVRDTLKYTIAKDFQAIEEQLIQNQKNNDYGIDEVNKYVFHSSFSVQSTAGETYLYWKKEMNHPTVKSSYNAGASNELEINRILDDLHKLHGRKLVVYMTSVMTYPDAKYGYTNEDGAMERTPAPRFFGRYGLKYSLNALIGEAEKAIDKEMYDPEHDRDFTVISVIRFIEFNIEKKETTKITYEFDNLADLKEKFSLKHIVSLLPAKYINNECQKNIRSIFNSQSNSNLLEFVKKIAVKFNDVTCDPSIACDVTAKPLMLAIDNNNADEVYSALSHILHVTPGQTRGSFGDPGLNYDMYMKTLRFCLSFERRIKAIKLIVKSAWVSAPKEKMLIGLIEYIPDNQRNLLLERLKSEKINNVCLLTLLYRAVDGDNFDLLVNAMWSNIKSCRKNNLKAHEAYSQTKWQIFGRGYWATNTAFEESISDEGKISLHTTSTLLRDGYEPGRTLDHPTNNLDPYEYILVSFKSDYSFGKNKYHKDDAIFIPACIVYGMFNAENNERLLNGSLLVIDAALVTIGIGEIRAAIRAGEYGFQFALAVVDLGVGISSLYIDNVLAGRLEQSAEGRKFLEAYTYFNIFYGVSSFGGQMLDNALKMKNASSKFSKDRKIIGEDGSEYYLKQSEIDALENSADRAVGLCRSVASGNFPETTLKKLRNKQYSSVTDAEKQVLRDRGIPEEHWDDAACLTTANCNIVCTYPGVKCFVAGTLVETSNGKKAIEKIVKGDLVKSFNHKIERSVFGKVASVKTSITAILTGLILSTGDTIWATPEHPFYSGNQYIEASDLKVGSILQPLGNELVTVSQVISKDSSAQVYNFTVEENNNYYVGKIPVLVHNDCFLDKLKQNYRELYDKLDNLSPDLKEAFHNDFANAPNTVLSSLNTPNGFNLWKKSQSYPKTQKEAFLNDFTKKKAFRDALVNDPSLVDEWKFLSEAGMSNPEKFRIDIASYPRIRQLRQNKNMQGILPRVLRDGKQKYATVDDLMKAYLKNYTKAFTTSGGVLELNDELENFLKFFSDDASLALHNKTGANSFLEEMFQTPSKFKGGSFQLDLIYRQPRPTLLQNKTVVGFEFHIDPNTSSNRMDILFQGDGADNLLKVECKNYQSVTYFDWRNRVTKETLQSTTFKNQFMSYLKSSDSWDDFAYFFKDRRGISVDEIKIEFQKIFREKADEIFDNGALNPDQIQNYFGVTSKQDYLLLFQEGAQTNTRFFNFIQFE